MKAIIYARVSKEMIAAIKKDKTVKYIIVNQADRFSRNAGQAINIINDLKAQGVTVVEASTGSDTSIPEGVMMMQFKLSLAQWDKENENYRTIDENYALNIIPNISTSYENKKEGELENSPSKITLCG